MSDFKWRYFEGEVILWAVHLYCRCGVRYRDLEQMMAKRGLAIEHSTIYRRVQTYAPEIGAATLALAAASINELTRR